MADLKLGNLPDRTPSKMTITVSADLNQAQGLCGALPPDLWRV
ncbi:DUF2274 domain-containing protein [Mesorhizobium sp. 131-3-5]